MRYRKGMRWILALFTFAWGCAILSPLPDMRTPNDRARELAPKCSAQSDSGSLFATSPALVESVEPAYSFVASGPVDRQARLRGARLHLRPTTGLSRESLQRSLECHEGNVLLGRASELVDDPFVLPDVWLDILAESEGDGYVVTVRTESLDDARRVLDRARRFAARGRLESSPHAVSASPRP